MYEVTINANSLPELAEAVLSLGQNLMGIPSTQPAPAGQNVAAAPATRAAPRRAAAPAAAPEQPKALDFNTDVAPVVIATVEKHGKPLVVSVLDQFGAAKASDVPPDQWPELLDAINNAVAEAEAASAVV